MPQDYDDEPARPMRTALNVERLARIGASGPSGPTAKRIDEIDALLEQMSEAEEGDDVLEGEIVEGPMPDEALEARAILEARLNKLRSKTRASGLKEDAAVFSAGVEIVAANENVSEETLRKWLAEPGGVELLVDVMEAGLRARGQGPWLDVPAGRGGEPLTLEEAGLSMKRSRDGVTGDLPEGVTGRSGKVAVRRWWSR